jgi:glycopeptide antibiotics resistance protein
VNGGRNMNVISKKFNAKLIFIVYVIGLVNFVIVKYFGNIQRVFDRIEGTKAQRMDGYSKMQLIPFRTINSSIDSYIHVGMDPSSINFIANIAVFVPMGFLIPFILRKPSFLKTLGISLSIIVSIEIIQYITYLGYADIDDVILNMFGCVIGYMFYVISIALHKKFNQGFRAFS